MKGFVFSAYGICVSILCISLAGCTNPSTRPTQFTTATSRGNGAVTTPLSAPGGTPSQANTDCVGDDEPLAVTPGWKLLWQHVFEHPITRPPEITDSQVIIVERADPFSGEGIDTVWALNPQTSATQWRFEGTNDVAAYEFRHVINLHWSQKYVVLHVQYGTPDSAPAYAAVLDRLTGRLVLSQRLYSDETTVSDDALYYRGIYRELHRMNLPEGTPRWSATLAGGNGLRGLFALDSRLYAFNNDQHIFQYDSIDGSLVATATIGVSPILGDVLVQGHTAVVRSWYGGEGVTRFDLDAFATQWMTRVPTADGNMSNTFWRNLPSMGLTSDSIYLFDAQNNLWRLDLSTGQVVWSVPATGMPAMSRPVVMQGLVYALFADGTVRAYSEADGKEVGVVLTTPLWYWTETKEWRDVVGGLGVAGDTLIVTTGCRGVYALQREPQ